MGNGIEVTPQPKVIRRRKRMGRPPKITSADHMLVAAAVALLRWNFSPVRSKRQRGAADEVSRRMGGLIGADRVEQLYKRYRRRLPKTISKLGALSLLLTERFPLPMIPDPALDTEWLKKQTRESLTKWFQKKYFQRWKNPRQKRAAWKALQEELHKHH